VQSERAVRARADQIELFLHLWHGERRRFHQADATSR
jgi:hypothetical protein